MNDDTELPIRLAEMESRAPSFSPPALPAERRHHLPLSAASAVVPKMKAGGVAAAR